MILFMKIVYGKKWKKMLILIINLFVEVKKDMENIKDGHVIRPNVLNVIDYHPLACMCGDNIFLAFLQIFLVSLLEFNIDTNSSLFDTIKQL